MAQYQIEMSGAVTALKRCECESDDAAITRAAQLAFDCNQNKRGLGGKCSIVVTDENGDEVAQYEATWETWH